MEPNLRLLHLSADEVERDTPGPSPVSPVTAQDPQAVPDCLLKRGHTVDLAFSADEAQTAIREITMALALSQEFMKHDKTLSQQALDTILAKRTAGEGWGKIAHDLNPKLGQVRSEVEKAEKRIARVERVEKTDKVETAGDPPQEGLGRDPDQGSGFADNGRTVWSGPGDDYSLGPHPCDTRSATVGDGGPFAEHAAGAACLGIKGF